MKKYLVITFAFLAITSSFGQNEQSEDLIKKLESLRTSTLIHDTLSWEKNPIHENLSKELNEEPEILLKDSKYHVFDFISNTFLEYRTIHKIIRVNSDDAVQANNKVYIPLYNNVLGLVTAKARVITPDNKIINFDSTNIQYSAGGEDRPPHKYFAIDGVENGSDIEFLYTIVKSPSLEGNKVTIQNDEIKKNVEFVLACPENLEFAFKSYNNAPKVISDSTYKDSTHRVYKMYGKKIDKLLDEDYAHYSRESQHIIYKLDKNISRGTNNIVSFDDFSTTYFNNLQIDNSRDKKAVAKFIKASGASKQTTEDDKIRTLENYIKKNIHLNGTSNNTMVELLKNKTTNDFGRMKLFVNGLNQLGIKYEIIVTGNNFGTLFDKTFQHNAVLLNAFIYINKSKKYLSVNRDEFRYGIVPASWTNQDGLFIKPITAGGIESAIGKVKFIKPLKAENSIDLMNVSINLDDLSEPELTIKRELTGYSAVSFQYIYPYLDQDTKDKIDPTFINFPDENAEIISNEGSGFDESDLNVNPIVFNGKIKSSALTEKARDQYILNLGKIIGPQFEMYDSLKRQMNIGHNNNMTYDRSISFQIPEGYEVSGLEKIIINAEFEVDGKKNYFKSNYKVNDDLVTVTIKEVYEEMYMDKKYIEQFREVVNAAANFNKVVVFLTKK